MLEPIQTQFILFFILYGITGVVPFMFALYLLLRPGNAFAPGVTPPLRLRRWAASFLFVASLGHLWWLLFYIYSNDIHSVAYLLVVALDFVGMVTTIAGTMLSMLQDRRRPIWPAFVVMIPFLALGVLQMHNPYGPFMDIAIAYNLALYVLFFIYMVFAVRRYGRWLNDNYADLENKRVWLSQAVSLAFVLLFALYALVDTNVHLIYLLHIVELVFFSLLLWRVESLPQLDSVSKSKEENTSDLERLEDGATAEMATSESDLQAQKSNHLRTNIEYLLAERCVDAQLYLQHDLSLVQLSASVGINRSYLSQYFSSLGMNYNTYINGLRINHFVNLYSEALSQHRIVTAQQLALESGYHSYSTFSLAFKQRMGMSVTAWMREQADSTS